MNRAFLLSVFTLTISFTITFYLIILSKRVLGSSRLVTTVPHCYFKETVSIYIYFIFSFLGIKCVSLCNSRWGAPSKHSKNSQFPVGRPGTSSLLWICQEQGSIYIQVISNYYFENSILVLIFNVIFFNELKYYV